MRDHGGLGVALAGLATVGAWFVTVTLLVPSIVPDRVPAPRVPGAPAVTFPLPGDFCAVNNPASRDRPHRRRPGEPRLRRQGVAELVDARGRELLRRLGADGRRCRAYRDGRQGLGHRHADAARDRQAAGIGDRHRKAVGPRLAQRGRRVLGRVAAVDAESGRSRAVGQGGRRPGVSQARFARVGVCAQGGKRGRRRACRLAAAWPPSPAGFPSARPSSSESMGTASVWTSACRV